MKFDILRDFAPVSQLVSSPSMLVTPAKLPFGTLKDFIAGVKAKPGTFNYGSAGAGTQPHMAMELFRDMAGIDMQHIPYKGIAPALNGVIADQVSAIMINPLSAKSQIDAGKVRGLGISSTTRSAIMPDIPTIAEQVPGYEAIQWYGLFAPAGTPAPIVARLHKEIAAALKVAGDAEAHGGRRRGGGRQLAGRILRADQVRAGEMGEGRADGQDRRIAAKSGRVRCSRLH